MSKIYIKNHPPEYGAGFWIYRGYAAAWQDKGYEVEFFDKISDINDSNYSIMTTDGSVGHDSLDVISKANKTYLYVQPNTFPDPWGQHPNFQSLCPESVRDELNKIDSVVQWTYGDVTEHHKFWNNPVTIPLAFDSVNYKKQDGEELFDVCFVGGVANNGFNEKLAIMINHLKAFKKEHDKSGMRCGFFIGQNLSHEQEQKVISCSKICINIHDKYQRVLGLDTNERTFKTLGLNGALVSDEITQLNRLFPEVPTSSDPEMMVEEVKKLLSKTKSELLEYKQENIQNILNNHTYIKRVEQMEKI